MKNSIQTEPRDRENEWRPRKWLSRGHLLFVLLGGLFLILNAIALGNTIESFEGEARRQMGSDLASDLQAVYTVAGVISWFAYGANYLLLIVAWRKCCRANGTGRLWTNLYAGSALLVNCAAFVLSALVTRTIMTRVENSVDPLTRTFMGAELRAQIADMGTGQIAMALMLAACLSVYPIVCLIAANAPFARHPPQGKGA